MNRRKFIGVATGTATATVLGGAALSGSAAADLTVNTTDGGDGQTVTVTTDDGDVSEVSISPYLNASWSGFDEAAEEIRFLVEAKRDSEPEDAYTPVLRETPWLHSDTKWPESQYDPATSGEFNAPIFSRASDFVADGETFEPSQDNYQVPRIVLYTDDYAVPDYAASHEDGTSIGDLSQYSYTDQLVNGKYGVAGDTTAFDENNDGTTSETTVNVRYTVSLHTKEEYSPLVMSGGEEDDYASELPEGTDPGALTHAEMRAIADTHPAVETVTDTFTVAAENVASTTDQTVTTNPSAE